MGLVDYSSSDESNSEVTQKPIAPAPTTTATGKKPFQKLVNSSGSSKIFVNLPTAAATTDETSNEPPAKRARTVDSGASRFSNFGSFLPPPKKTTATVGKSVSDAPTSSGRTGGTAPAPGVHLRTGAEPAFTRGGGDADESSYGGEHTSASGSDLNLPPPKRSSGPTIQEGQKPAEEVKFVGQPWRFKPLSVLKAGQNKKKKTTKAAPSPTKAETSAPQQAAEPAPPKKKLNLFSLDDTPPPATTPASPTPATSYETYKPMSFKAAETTDTDVSNQGGGHGNIYNQQPSPQQQSALGALADSLSLSKADRRNLFGRNGPPSATAGVPEARILNFNMEKEYDHNEFLRQSGALADQVHNPVRSIAPGKHSLKQMVNMAQNNQAALEDSFAAGKGARRDAAGKYGWK